MRTTGPAVPRRIREVLMSTLWYRAVRISFVLSMLTATDAIADSAYVAPRTEKRQITCECIASSDLCERKFFDVATGKQRHSWYQDGNFIEGKEYDLDAACYRARKVDGRGDGFCCDIPNDDKTSKRFFRGTVEN